MMQSKLHPYYEGLNEVQQACFRWCASQLFKDELQEMEAQELYGDDFAKLSNILQSNVTLELEKLGTIGPCAANLLDGVLESVKEHGRIQDITDLVCELTQVPHDATELSKRLRAAFPDKIESIELEVQRRRTPGRHKERTR